MNKPTNHRAAVAAELRAALARDGRTASALATDAGISRGALSRKMRGESAVTIDELLSIASALGIPPGALVPADVQTRAVA